MAKTCFLFTAFGKGKYKDMVDKEISTARSTREPVIVAGINNIPCLDFDGSNDNILKTVDDDLNFRKAFTCFVLFKLDQLKNYNHIISRQDSEGFNFDIYISIDGEISTRLRNHTGSPATYSSSSGLIKANVWYFLAISWTAQNALNSYKYYLNGVEVYSINPTYTQLTNSLGLNFAIGSYYGDLSFTDGKVQYVKIDRDDEATSHIYSATEHKELNKQIRTISFQPDKSKAIFLMEANDLTTIKDKSGKGNHLTIGSTAPTFVTGGNNMPAYQFGTNSYARNTNITMPAYPLTAFFKVAGDFTSGNTQIFHIKKDARYLTAYFKYNAGEYNIQIHWSYDDIGGDYYASFTVNQTDKLKSFSRFAIVLHETSVGFCELYQDGLYVGSSAYGSYPPNSLAGSCRLTLGNADTEASINTRRIQDFQLYEGALSAVEVVSEMKEQLIAVGKTDNTGLIFVGGAKSVSSWTNKVSGGLPLTQGTAGNQFAIGSKQGCNGQDVYISSANKFMTANFGAYDGSNGFEITMVIKLNNTNDMHLFGNSIWQVGINKNIEMQIYLNKFYFALGQNTGNLHTEIMSAINAKSNQMTPVTFAYNKDSKTMFIITENEIKTGAFGDVDGLIRATASTWYFSHSTYKIEGSIQDLIYKQSFSSITAIKQLHKSLRQQRS